MISFRRPRDAATLILIRGSGPHREVLMGRRRDDARFLPGHYVFPGGAVDASDSRARPASGLDPAAPGMMAVGGRAARARTLAMTAVRETFEETGLLVGERGDVGNLPLSTWATIRRMGVAPALARLTYVGRAITSARRPIRFHARFFLANACHATGELESDGELADIGWIPLDETPGLLLADATKFMIEYVARLIRAPASVQPGRPVFLNRDGKPRITYDQGST